MDTKLKQVNKKHNFLSRLKRLAKEQNINLQKADWNTVIFMFNDQRSVEEALVTIKERIEKQERTVQYLRVNGWKPKIIKEVGFGWVDPETQEHYFESDAIRIQNLRSRHETKRFGREPGYYG